MANEPISLSKCMLELEQPGELEQPASAAANAYFVAAINRVGVEEYGDYEGLTRR